MSSASTKCQICGQDNPPEAIFCGNCSAALVVAAKPPSSVVETALAIEYMSGMTRLGAAIIDGVIVLFIPLSLLVLIVLLTSWSLAALPWAMLLFLLPMLCWLPYHWIFTTVKGQTPGKMVVGIKVVDAQNNRPTLMAAFVREILGKVISTAGLCLGFLLIDINKQKQGWHDRIAGTHVIKVVKTKSTE